MKKKVCKWLDSNEMGGLLFNDKVVSSCCNKDSVVLLKRENLDFASLTKEEIQKVRIELFENINNNTINSCNGCPYLIEKEESQIDIASLSFLGLGNFKTCNFRCKYCDFTDEELNEKLDKNKTTIFPIIKNLHNQGLLKENINLALTGGEPTLIEDIFETCDFLAKNYKYPQITFVSNSSLTKRIEKLSKKLGELPQNITKTLITSFDAGTPETYKELRGQDLFYNTINNIITYTKNKSFNFYCLKYIFQTDLSNISDEDIFGFLNIVKLMSQNYSANININLDRDISSDKTQEIDDKIIEAAGKMHYVATEILDVSIAHFGVAFSHNDHSAKDSDRICDFAQKYKTQKKSTKEQYFLNLLSAKNNLLPEIDEILITYENTIKNFIKENQGKEIYLYGAGKFAKRVLCHCDFSSLNIQGVIDKDPNKRGTEICGYKVYSTDDIKDLKPKTLVLTVLQKHLILPALEKLKADKNYDFEIIHNLFNQDF